MCTIRVEWVLIVFCDVRVDSESDWLEGMLDASGEEGRRSVLPGSERSCFGTQNVFDSAVY